MKAQQARIVPETEPCRLPPSSLSELIGAEAVMA
jgi:hypothetical protein